MNPKRTKAFEALLNALQETVDNHQQSVDQIQNGLDLDETETRTIGAMSQQDEQSDIRNTMQIALENAQAELANVKQFESKDLSTIQPGAFVETKDLIFFIGASQRSIPFGDKEIMGISTAAPAYAEISGLSKGDTFRLGEDLYTIEDLY